MHKLVQEFRDFAVRGNALDMAIGIVIGAAFTKVVNSLVGDIIMPPLGFLMRGIDLSDYAFVIQGKEGGQPFVLLSYGSFLNAILNGFIVALAIFALVKVINQFRREAPEPTPTTKICPQCALEIPINAKRCGHCTTQFSI